MKIPFGEEIRIIQYSGDDTSPVIRRIAVHSTNNQSQLRLDLNELLRVVHDDDEIAGALVVETEVFCETLGA